MWLYLACGSHHHRCLRASCSENTSGRPPLNPTAAGYAHTGTIFGSCINQLSRRDDASLFHETNRSYAETEILSRDLKVDNLVVGRDGVIKLCDFGSCSTDHRAFYFPKVGYWASCSSVALGVSTRLCRFPSIFHCRSGSNEPCNQQRA